MIRQIVPEDVISVCGIYNYYVKNTIITFEESPVEEHEMLARMRLITGKHPWIVYEEDGALLGYAYASDWKTRSAYRHTVETTVYLRPDSSGKGIGYLLYAELIRQLKERKIHAAIGGIALPNDASVGLHEKLGFRNIGRFHEVGWKFGNWIDVGYWELILD